MMIVCLGLNTMDNCIGHKPKVKAVAALSGRFCGRMLLLSGVVHISEWSGERLDK